MIPALSRWENYYVVVGSSAGALTGLQFVVITLIAQRPARGSSSMRQISAFGTPTVAHFCSALLIAAILSAPWNSLAGPAATLAALGLAGIVYGFVVIHRARSQEGYRPVLSDWIWHTALPLIAYAAVLLAALWLGADAHGSLFAIGAASLLLLFIGIHNSWDTVTYVAIVRPSEGRAHDTEPEPEP